MPIKNITDVKVVGSSLKKKSVAKIDTNITEPRFVDVDKVELDKLMVTLNNLVAFKESVAKYGLTRSLVAFADHDKSLSSVIPQVPALENLASDRSVKNSNDVVVAVEAKISTILEYIGQSLKDRFLNLFKRGQYKLKIYNESKEKIDTFSKILNNSDRIFDAQKTTIKLEKFPPYEELIDVMNMIISLNNIFMEIASKPLPCNEEEFTHWQTAVIEKLKPVGAILYVHIVPNSTFHADDCLLLKHREPETMEKLGYVSVERFNSVYTHLQTVWRELDKGYREYDESRLYAGHVKENTDKKIVNKSFGIICDIFQNVDEAMGWLNHCPEKILKTIFWCSEKKKD